MFSDTRFSPVTIRESERKGSLGGHIAERLYKTTFIFNEEESIMGATQYKFFYLVNELRTDFIVYKVRIKSFIEYAPFHLDKFWARFLANISTDIVILNFFDRNSIHKSYTKTGEILEFGGRNVREFIHYSGQSFEIKEGLSYQEFFPFALRVRITAPIERVIELPVVLNVKTYLR